MDRVHENLQVFGVNIRIDPVAEVGNPLLATEPSHHLPNPTLYVLLQHKERVR